MTFHDYPNSATVQWHQFLVEAVAEGFGRWRGAAGEMESARVFAPLKMRWIRIYMWAVAKDENEETIYLYDDGSISYIVKYRFGFWPVRRRYALIAAKMPLSADGRLMAVRASIGAPSVQEMYNRSLD
ncbi:MAG: hypothetical protein JWN75_403 [Candidatus Saccharibacteria bacterium]|nr:hypothetical protein [Candidatus Saccharibacteria bacterium]